ncbi:MAG: DUF2029 domain-containing protein [Elusimicrobia bacterium]|nr:DUF2029 domain-containing protein [Elusimicrobiota bacterium]
MEQRDTQSLSRSASAKFLLVIASSTLAGHAALRLYAPLRQHIPEFLAIYAALCLLSMATAFWLTDNAPVLEPLSARARAALPWLILGCAALFRLVLIWGPPMISTDVYRYAWDGRVQLAGINPYLHAPSSAELASLRASWHGLINHPELSTIYPPLAQWVFRLAATASPAVLAQKGAFVFFDLLTIWLLMRFLSARGQSAAWATLYAWHPLPVIEFAGSGHLDPLMMFAMLAGLYLLERGRPLAGCAVLGLSAMAKLAPLVMIPWVLVQRRRGPALAYFGVIALCVAPFAGDLWEAYRQGLPMFVGMRAFASEWLTNPGLFSLAIAVIADPAARRIAFAAALGTLSIPWALANRDRPTAYALGCLFALLLCSPVVQPWYVLWLLPLLCLHRLWSALAWTWLVGLAYLMVDSRLRTSPWLVPASTLLWLAQYGTVLGLLLWEIGRLIQAARCNVSPAATTQFQETNAP